VAKQVQSAAYDWQRLKPFQIGDLGEQFNALGNLPFSVRWGSDSSAAGLATDVGDACHQAQWSVCTSEQLPDNIVAFGITVHWRAGYQSIAKAIGDSLTDVIGMPVGVAPIAELDIPTPVGVTIGRKLR